MESSDTATTTASFCWPFVDPEDAYKTIETLPRVSVRGGEEVHIPARLHTLHYPDRSVVIGVSGMKHTANFEYIGIGGGVYFA